MGNVRVCASSHLDNQEAIKHQGRVAASASCQRVDLLQTTNQRRRFWSLALPGEAAGGGFSR